MDAAAIDRIAMRIADAVASGEVVAPGAVRLLLRRFIASGEEFRAPLAAALGATAADGGGLDPERLLLLAEATQISDDPPLRASLLHEATRISSSWPSRGSVSDAARGIDGCLVAAAALGVDLLLAKAVDELERVVGLAYEPGDGVSQQLSTRTRSTGDLAAHTFVASALLNAYEMTSRPAYPMLAEELVRLSLSLPRPQPPDLVSFETARVLTRLALLQRDPEYLEMAVTRQDARYQQLAGEWLCGISDASLSLPLAAGYGLAVDEWLRLT